MTSTASQSAQLISIHIGRVAPLKCKRGDGDFITVMSGIRKTAVSTIESPQPIPVTRMGLAGDEQCDLTVHGGLEKAVYAYPSEHYTFWQKFLKTDSPLPNGIFGENLVISGLMENCLWVGDELHFAHCVLSVESPRRPCYKLNAILNNHSAAREMVQQRLTGWYLSVVEPGAISAGETIKVVPGPRTTSLNDRQEQMTRAADLR